jgi:hypothetical protein
VSENLPVVIASLLEVYATVCPRLSPEQHLAFVDLLIYSSPATATLRALSSHLSMVAPVASKQGFKHGGLEAQQNATNGTASPGRGSLGTSDPSGARWGEVQQEHSSTTDTYETGADALSIREAVVQPISAEFVAQVLAIRVQPGSIDPQKLLPEHLQAQSDIERVSPS